MTNPFSRSRASAGLSATSAKDFIGGSAGVEEILSIYDLTHPKEATCFCHKLGPIYLIGKTLNMKPIPFLFILVTVFLCFVLNSRLQQREADLVAAEAKIKATEVERVPLSDLHSTQNNLLDAEKKILALEEELKKSEGHVAALSGQVAAMESQPHAPRSLKPRPVAKAGLIKGGFRIMEENVVYLPESQYRIGEDLFVTSPQGMMMSDKDQTIFGGDLLLQTPQGTIQGDDAVLEVTGETAILTAKQVKVALRKTADGGAGATNQSAATAGR